MNDLDLRTALHRDADLAGEPPADLLDQLVRRRRDQRRRRAGALGGVAAVVVLAAGVPIGASIVGASDGGPAGPATTPTAEAVPSEVTPPTAAPEPEAEVVPPPVAPRTPVEDDTPPEAPAEQPAAVETPSCPGAATLDAAMPADTADRRYEIGEGTPVCSGTWAAVGFTEYTVWQGEWKGDGGAAVFRYVDGAWTLISTTNGDRSPACDDPAIPPVIWERGCAVD